jgi:hypothetical protein
MAGHRLGAPLIVAGLSDACNYPGPMSFSESPRGSRRQSGQSPNWPEVAARALVELGRHGPDGLVVVCLFALLPVAMRQGASPSYSLFGLVICGCIYLALRLMGQRHAVNMATLSVNREAARIGQIVTPHREAIGTTQTTMALERRPRPLT